MDQQPRSEAIEDGVRRILEHAGAHIVLAAPLGIGKPNHLLNAIYRHVAADRARRLTICTALSLAIPRAGSSLERRFLAPFVARHFGEDYPELDYVAAMRGDRLPGNIRVREFYFQSGAMLGSLAAQSDYTSLNYTHVARDLVGAGINVIVHLVAKSGDGSDQGFSLGSNPDVTLDLLDGIADAGLPRPLVVGVVSAAMPFLGGDAAVDACLFDVIIDDTFADQRLFAVPREDVDDSEHAIGLHASTLVRDGGTLQIGIGALSDALVHAMLLRHRDNAAYRATLGALQHDPGTAADAVAPIGGVQAFEHGLYGSSEMVMDGFMHLRRAGILTREVYDDIALQRALDAGVVTTTLRSGDARRLREAHVVPARLDGDAVTRLVALGLLPRDARVSIDGVCSEGQPTIGADLDQPEALAAFDTVLAGRRLRGGRYLQGGFFLGSRDLYDWLRALDGDDHAGLAMSRISSINMLERGRETLAAVQRRDARFFNTCMMATPLGAAVSDALDDGRVVSGVGGQYNFVALGHLLAGARSILMLRSTRIEHGRLTSNIRWNYGHVTIPRHLRDVFVTEYGIANLRGKSDRDCVLAMLAIADARFQAELVDAAIAARKLPRDFRIPEAWRLNTAQALAARVATQRKGGVLPDWPFGSDFDATERQLLVALGMLRVALRSRRGWPRLAGMWMRGGPRQSAALARMGLDAPRAWRERALARLLRGALAGAASRDADAPSRG
jgi:acyl-CoA hydrolase